MLLSASMMAMTMSSMPRPTERRRCSFFSRSGPGSFGIWWSSGPRNVIVDVLSVWPYAFISPQ